MMAAAATNGEVLVDNVRMDHMMAVVDKLREIGIDVDKSNGGVNVASARHLEPTDVTTQPYPGFPTDLQAQLLTLLCLADGNSAITEKIFPDRFMHVAELLRMGADIRKEGPTAIVTGVKKLVACRSWPATCGPPRPWSSPAWSPRARPPSSASTTSTAATRPSRTNSARSARTSPASPND